MSRDPSFSERTRRGATRVERFLREYTAGVSGDELRRMFEKDGAEAYSVLTRDMEPPPSSRDWVHGAAARARLFFLGLSYKLTPARRLLFAAALLMVLLGILLPSELRLAAGRISLDYSPFWFLTSVVGLVYLLALELMDRVRVRDELEVARRLQKDLLPRDAWSVPGYRAAHSYRTANEVGGDYYQMPVLPDGRIALMIGDASGHGMAAGLVMAIADATVKTALDLDPAPRRVAAILNRALCRTGGRRAFLSFFYALLDPASGALDYVCAGHPFPLLRHAAGGAVEELGEGGLPLGLRPDLEPPIGATRLDPGDLLVLYTDGVAEVQSPAGEAFGFERLRQVVAEGGSSQTTHDALLHAVGKHRGDAPLADDMTVLLVERLATTP